MKGVNRIKRTLFCLCVLLAWQSFWQGRIVSADADLWATYDQMQDLEYSFTKFDVQPTPVSAQPPALFDEYDRNNALHYETTQTFTAQPVYVPQQQHTYGQYAYRQQYAYGQYAYIPPQMPRYVYYPPQVRYMSAYYPVQPDPVEVYPLEPQPATEIQQVAAIMPPQPKTQFPVPILKETSEPQKAEPQEAQLRITSEHTETEAILPATLTQAQKDLINELVAQQLVAEREQLHVENARIIQQEHTAQRQHTQRMVALSIGGVLVLAVVWVWSGQKCLIILRDLLHEGYKRML